MSTIAFIGVGQHGRADGAQPAEGAGPGPRVRRQPRGAQADGRGGRASRPRLRSTRCKGADVVVTMLPAGKHVRSVYLEEASILTAARKDALLIDCSTIDIDSARAVHAAAEQGRIRLPRCARLRRRRRRGGRHTRLHVRRQRQGVRARQTDPREDGQAHRPCRRSPAQDRRRRSATTCCSRSR